METAKKGLLITISGASGCGKGTVIELLKTKIDFEMTVSATTRPMRSTEVNGREYFFYTKEEFEEADKKGEFLEWGENFGNYYGTLRGPLEEKMARGVDVLIELGVDGALKIKETFPETITIYLVPPTFEELSNRLARRKSETDQKKKERLEGCKTEALLIEKCDYIVLNDDIEKAAERIIHIIEAGKLRTFRNMDMVNYWKSLYT